MKKLLSALSLLLAVILLSSCSLLSEQGFLPFAPASIPAAPSELQEPWPIQSIPDLQNDADALLSLFAAVNAERRQLTISSTAENLSAYTPSFHHEVGSYDQAFIDSVIYPPEPSQQQLTAQQCAEDIDTTFELLRLTYGAYYYFGGEAVFEQARLQAHQEFAALTADGQITGARLLAALQSALHFIQDGHFSIGNVALTAHQNPYYWPDHLLEKGEDGNYYLPRTQNGHTYYWQLVSVDSQPPDEYLRPTLSPTGRLTYGLFYSMSTLPNEDPAERLAQQAPQTALFTLGSVEEEIPITWLPAWQSDLHTHSHDIYSSSQLNGIAVHTLSSFWVSSAEDDAALNLFINNADQLRQEELFIIDLRGNTGGNNLYVDQWYTAYTGNTPRLTQSLADKSTSLALQALIAQDPYNPAAIYHENWPNPDSGQWNTSYSQAVWYENEPLIIVLIDKNTGSAAEAMLQYLKTMNNVLIVGVNTSGATLVPNNSLKYLPHSGIPLWFGQGLLLLNGAQNLDGIGLSPDIWVNGSQALERVLAMCSYYSLQGGQTP